MHKTLNVINPWQALSYSSYKVDSLLYRWFFRHTKDGTKIKYCSEILLKISRSRTLSECRLEGIVCIGKNTCSPMAYTACILILHPNCFIRRSPQLTQIIFIEVQIVMTTVVVGSSKAWFPLLAYYSFFSKIVAGLIEITVLLIWTKSQCLAPPCSKTDKTVCAVSPKRPSNLLLQLKLE